MNSPTAMHQNCLDLINKFLREKKINSLHWNVNILERISTKESSLQQEITEDGITIKRGNKD